MCGVSPLRQSISSINTSVFLWSNCPRLIQFGVGLSIRKGWTLVMAPFEHCKKSRQVRYPGYMINVAAWRSGPRLGPPSVAVGRVSGPVLQRACTDIKHVHALEWYRKHKMQQETSKDITGRRIMSTNTETKAIIPTTNIHRNAHLMGRRAGSHAGVTCLSNVCVRGSLSQSV